MIISSAASSLAFLMCSVSHFDNHHHAASDFGEDVNPHHAFHRAGGYHQDGQTMLSSGSRGGGGQVMTPTHNRLQNEVPQERLQALLQGLRESKHMQEQSHVAGEAAISTSLSYGRYVQADNTPTDLSYVLSSLLSGTISDPRVCVPLLLSPLGTLFHFDCFLSFVPIHLG